MQKIINGDCLEIMKSFPDNHFTSIITDPPYGLKFMGKEWDHGIPSKVYWAEALRICKPGSMLLAFGGTRTSHRLTCAIEDAGWEIRDCICWLYGSGFPKSHNFGRQLGEEWKSYGTALKPSHEPIIVAMKPLDGTYAQNAEKWGIAGINIDECRIQSKEQWTSQGELRGGESLGRYGDGLNNSGRSESHSEGRWPANLILDEEAAAQLDQQTGILKSGAIKPTHKNKGLATSNNEGYKRPWHENAENIGWDIKADSGGASRFFYCPKASSSERNKGLEGMPLKEKKTLNEYVNPSEGRTAPKSGSAMQNTHPTVKPIALMEYLIKLVMPPKDGLILDPFAGSGTTLIAAKRLGYNAIGIEKEQEYAEIATKRLEAYTEVSEQYHFTSKKK